MPRQVRICNELNCITTARLSIEWAPAGAGYKHLLNQHFSICSISVLSDKEQKDPTFSPIWLLFSARVCVCNHPGRRYRYVSVFAPGQKQEGKLQACSQLCATALKVYKQSLANVDWLHGSAESMLTLTNLFIGVLEADGCEADYWQLSMLALCFWPGCYSCHSCPMLSCSVGPAARH